MLDIFFKVTVYCKLVVCHFYDFLFIPLQSNMYGTDHMQRHIHLRSWICSRLNNCQGRGCGTCFACECTPLSVLRDIRKRNRCHALFWAIIKPWANPRVWVSATLREICTVCYLNFLLGNIKFKFYHGNTSFPMSKLNQNSDLGRTM